MLGMRGFLAGLHGLASLQKTLQPPEDALPAIAVASQVNRSAGKSLLTDFQKRTCAGLPRTARMKAMHSVRLKFPAHHSLERAGPTGNPGMDQQAGWIHFQVLSLDRKGCAISVGTDARPFSAGAKIRFPRGDAMYPVLTPPLGHLVGVGNCFEYPSRRRRDEDLSKDCVLIGSDCDGCQRLLLNLRKCLTSISR